MQVEMDYIKARIARTDDTHNGVGIGSIIVEQPAGLVDDFCDLADVLIKEAQSVGIGEHQPCGVGAHQLFQGFHINPAPLVGRHFYYLVAHHGAAGGVGAMGRVRNDHLSAVPLTAVVVVGLDHHEPSQFPVGASRGLQRGLGEPGNGRQMLTEVVDELQGALDRLLGLVRMDSTQSRQAHHILMHPGIVLHGAGAQGVKAHIHSVIEPRELGVVAHNLRFAHLWEPGSLAAQILLGNQLFNWGFRNIKLWKPVAAATRRGTFKDQGDAGAHGHEINPLRAPTKASISSLVLASVTEKRASSGWPNLPKGSPPKKP